MTNNIDDEKEFYHHYSETSRPDYGLAAAGEWETFREMLPDLQGMHVLDLGCGYGWHCNYAIAHGAEHVVGIDISEKMLRHAKEQPYADRIKFIKGSIDNLEHLDFEDHEFDLVMSSLALHYISDFEDIVEEAKRILTINGTFIFSIEHPIYTAHGSQDWIYNEEGQIEHWPVDAYHREGERTVQSVDTSMVKYHRTLSHYLNILIGHQFVIKGIAEPVPDEKMMEAHPDMKNELRRPMMLIISARRK